MGFYDCRCMVTGISLKGVDAALIPLQVADKGYSPVTLAVKGNYNRYGSLDGIQEDANTALILQFFLRELDLGRFRVEQEYLEEFGHYPIHTIEHLLAGFERNMNDDPNAAMFDGQPVVFALICLNVWEAIVRTALPTKEPAATLFRHLFKDSPLAKGVYEGHLEAVSRHIHELSAIANFLDGYGLSWRPAEDPGQHYKEDLRQYLGEARQTFSDSTVVLGALDEYEREVADLLAEE